MARLGGADLDPATAVVLALNPGSSSLKAAVRGPQVALSVLVERIGGSDGRMVVEHDGERDEQQFGGDLGGAIDAVASQLRARSVTPRIVSHRVVHGGPSYHRPTLITDQLLEDLSGIVALAPLHLPGDIEAMRTAGAVWPDAIGVACFDTGFHHDLPEASRRLPIPEEFDRRGVRRYGFHGLSIQSTLRRHPDLGGTVIAHLGSGCSVSAVQDGAPRHTSMSFTPGGGMISSTRTGDIDPGVVLYLGQQFGYDADELRSILVHDSGLVALAAGRRDVRDLVPPRDERAALALDVFTTSAAMAVASAAITLDRWESLVFTGGIGEHSDYVRSTVCRKLLALRGVEGPNPSEPVERLTRSGVRVVVSSADEEGMLDALARELIDGSGDRR